MEWPNFLPREALAASHRRGQLRVELQDYIDEEPIPPRNIARYEACEKDYEDAQAAHNKALQGLFSVMRITETDVQNDDNNGKQFSA